MQEVNYQLGVIKIILIAQHIQTLNLATDVLYATILKENRKYLNILMI